MAPLVDMRQMNVNNISSEGRGGRHLPPPTDHIDADESSQDAAESLAWEEEPEWVPIHPDGDDASVEADEDEPGMGEAGGNDAAVLAALDINISGVPIQKIAPDQNVQLGGRHRIYNIGVGIMDV